MPILKKETSFYPDDLFERSLEDASRRWFAIFTKARQEKALSRDALSLGIPFYLPLVEKERIIRGRRIKSHIPLFSGYMFVFGSEEERVRCLTTNRVSLVLPVDDQADLCRDLQSVQRLIESNAPLTVERRLGTGARVRIRAGTLAGLEGTIIRRSKVTRLVVAVNYMQQGVSLEVDDCLVEPI